MKPYVLALTFVYSSSIVYAQDSTSQQSAERIEQVAQTKGLIAFWDFTRVEAGKWTSHYDAEVVQKGFPISLRQIGDAKAYAPADWSRNDEKSKLMFDSSGPFGQAVRFNKGYVFGEVPRKSFEGTPLDVHGQQPFTLIAWTKFVGKRHLVCGIWDEGGWDKYGGRRQISLFGGLFGSKGVIGHISTTGASSYPQSTARGSQYARCRAIDGKPFKNDQWVMMAMTFDPKTSIAKVYCNGEATPTNITDSVAKDVFHYPKRVSSNPYDFPWPIFSSRAFVLKFNGYKVNSTGVYEHWLFVDLNKRKVTYDRSSPDQAKVTDDFQVTFDVQRAGKSLLSQPITFDASPKASVDLPSVLDAKPGDQIVTSLTKKVDGNWKTIGKQVRYNLREGAPFTFGRALGLGSEQIEHGSQLYIDGVAVFNRVLTDPELRKLTFVGNNQ